MSEDNKATPGAPTPEDPHRYIKAVKKPDPVYPIHNWELRDRTTMTIQRVKSQNSKDGMAFSYHADHVPVDSEFFLLCLNRVRFMANNLLESERAKPSKDRISKQDLGVALAAKDFCQRLELSLCREIYMNKFMPEELAKSNPPKGL